MPNKKSTCRGVIISQKQEVANNPQIKILNEPITCARARAHAVHTKKLDTYMCVTILCNVFIKTDVCNDENQDHESH